MDCHSIDGKKGKTQAEERKDATDSRPVLRFVKRGDLPLRDFDFVGINTTEGAPSLRDFRKGGNSDCVQQRFHPMSIVTTIDMIITQPG
jgi:hypothetical protein